MHIYAEFIAWCCKHTNKHARAHARTHACTHARTHARTHQPTNTHTHTHTQSEENEPTLRVFKNKLTLRDTPASPAVKEELEGRTDPVYDDRREVLGDPEADLPESMSSCWIPSRDR